MAVGTLARADRATWTGAGDSVCQTLLPCALTIVFIAPGLLVCLVGDKSIVGDSGYRPNLPICQPYPRGAGVARDGAGGGRRALGGAPAAAHTAAGCVAAARQGRRGGPRARRRRSAAQGCAAQAWGPAQVSDV